MKLKSYREKHNMTQDYVARKIKKHVTTVCKYETGDIVPSLAAMSGISKLTEGKVTMHDFMTQHKQKAGERINGNKGNGTKKTDDGISVPSSETLSN